jgi:rRNA maturation RNase YbeY
VISIRNTQRKIHIDEKDIQKMVLTILNYLGYADFDIGIWITTNATIKKYNQQFRNKNKATDVLSFPYHHQAQPGKKIVAQSEDDKNLGDIIIAAQYVATAAESFNISFEDHLRTIIIHGICHLIGYDHISDSDYAVMHEQEKKIERFLKNKGM